MYFTLHHKFILVNCRSLFDLDKRMQDREEVSAPRCLGTLRAVHIIDLSTVLLSRDVNPGTSCPPTHKCASCKCRYACCCFLCCSQEWFVFLETFATHFSKHEKHGQVWPYCASSLFANLRNAPGVWSNISGQVIDSMLIVCVGCPYKGHATAIWCQVYHLGDAFKIVPFVCCDGYCGLLKRLSLECIAALLQNGVWNCHQCLLTVGWYTVYNDSCVLQQVSVKLHLWRETAWLVL